MTRYLCNPSRKGWAPPSSRTYTHRILQCCFRTGTEPMETWQSCSAVSKRYVSQYKLVWIGMFWLKFGMKFQLLESYSIYLYQVNLDGTDPGYVWHWFFLVTHVIIIFSDSLLLSFLFDKYDVDNCYILLLEYLTVPQSGVSRWLHWAQLNEVWTIKSWLDARWYIQFLIQWLDFL